MLPPPILERLAALEKACQQHGKNDTERRVIIDDRLQKIESTLGL